MTVLLYVLLFGTERLTMLKGKQTAAQVCACQCWVAWSEKSIHSALLCHGHLHCVQSGLHSALQRGLLPGSQMRYVLIIANFKEFQSFYAKDWRYLLEERQRPTPKALDYPHSPPLPQNDSPVSSYPDLSMTRSDSVWLCVTLQWLSLKICSSEACALSSYTIEMVLDFKNL